MTNSKELFSKLDAYKAQYAELVNQMQIFLFQNYCVIPDGVRIERSYGYADGAWSVALTNKGLILEGYAFENIGYFLEKQGVAPVEIFEDGWSALFTDKKAFESIGADFLEQFVEEFRRNKWA